jgi:hypothetical protein
MHRQMVVLGAWAMLLCLWSGVAQAVTLTVTDDIYIQIQQDKPTGPGSTAGGTAGSLVIDNTANGKENITFVVFDLGLISGVSIDHAVLRFYGNKVATAGAGINPSKINIFVVKATWNEGSLACKIIRMRNKIIFDSTRYSGDMCASIFFYHFNFVRGNNYAECLIHEDTRIAPASIIAIPNKQNCRSAEARFAAVGGGFLCALWRCLSAL